MPDQAPIQFQSPEEFQSRSNYASELRCDEADLKVIVGKYGFNEKQKLQCGLNGCNSWHWHGFVIATQSGKETHCGQDCGKRVFGVSWDDLHAEFRRQEDERDRALTLQRIKDDSASTLSRCKVLITQCKPLVQEIHALVNEMVREPALKRVFDATLKNSGRIMGEVEKTGFMADDGKSGKRDLILLATIEGGSAVESHFEVMRNLIFKVQNPITELIETDLSSLSTQAIKKNLNELREMSFSLVRAETFVSNAQRFLQPSNLQKIRLLLEQLPHKARTDRARRIAERLGN